MEFIVQLISRAYGLLWGDLITLPLPAAAASGFPACSAADPHRAFFTIPTRFLPRAGYFPEMSG